MADELMVNEIFYSIQGESTWAGLPCVFVRLTGCHLRCGYCDTEYAFFEGQRMTVEEIVRQVNNYGCPLAEVTGGEPLLQPGALDLMRKLSAAGKTVLLETSGACDIGGCDPRVIRIMDLKTPDSGESHRNLWKNIEKLTSRDEVKFVISSRRDYEWSKQVIEEHKLVEKVGAVLLSPVTAVGPGKELAGASGLELKDLAEWILLDGLQVRVQQQLHKLIWGPTTRGV
ncbi:MAG: radical SAM protein [Phycisphaeraceae bacterium]|nr:radical SAM protein [Phycisphaeraceae bacterium]